MKQISSKEIEAQDSGLMAMIYGSSGIGKSVSTLQSAPDPILYVIPEPRDVKRMLKAANRPDLKYKVAIYENWPDMIQFFADSENVKPYRSIVIDSLSHLMNIQLTSEIQDQSFEALDEKKATAKPLVMQTKMSEEGWGALASNMFRLCNLLMKLAATHGKIVICTALEESTPKWNRSLAAAPNFGGRMFNKNFPGFFDLIGLVQAREKDGQVVYPPVVHFASKDDDFIAKATGGMAKTSGPLDWAKILQL